MGFLPMNGRNLFFNNLTVDKINAVLYDKAIETYERLTIRSQVGNGIY